MENSDVTEFLIKAATQAGADAADALAITDRSMTIDFRGGCLEKAGRSESSEVGLRVLIGQRQSCVSGSDLRPEAMEEMASRAVAMARAAPPDPYAGLAEPEQLVTEFDISGLEMIDGSDEPTPTECEDDARRTEAAALSVSGVSQVDAASAGHAHWSVHIAATNGFSAGYRRGQRFISCSAIAGEGLEMENDGYSESRIFRSDMSSPEEIGRIAGERVVARLGSQRPRTGHFPVVFDERVASSIVGHVLAAANGSAIARGSSWLVGKMGEKLLPDGLDIEEEPLRKRSPSGRPFDAEGLPVRARKIVDDGVLVRWILDLATARKLGMQSTANAARSVAAPPAPAVSNTALTQTELSRDDLLREMGEGLLVTSMLGATINPTTGDYSRGASGFWVKNGAITNPVSELTIAGNLLNMLKSLLPANDAQPFARHRVPSLLVEGLTVAGT